MPPRVFRRPAARAHPRSRVLRRPAAQARPRSRAPSPDRPGLRQPSRRTTQCFIVDTNQGEDYDGHTFLDAFDGGILTLRVDGVSLRQPWPNRRALYQATIRNTSLAERHATGVDGDLLRATFVRWIERPQFDAVASQIGGFPW